MNIKNIRVEEINPAPYNPRIDLQPGDPEYDALKKSIEQFGYIDPLIWNEKTGHLVGGHQRYKILMENKPKEITVSVVYLNVDEEKALNIALNKISGDWDEYKLEQVLLELKVANFDMSLTGFSDEELLETLPSDTEIDTVEEDNFDVHTALGKIKEPETKYGDVWQLGRHTLVCGDATKLEDVKKLMGENKAALIVTDPPYNVAVKSDSKKLNDDGHASILNDEMAAAEFDEFLRAVFMNYSYVMNDQAAIYVFHPSSFQIAFENEMRNAGMEIRSQCVWVKNAPTFGWSQYRYQHEPVFYAYKKGCSPAWYGDRKQTTVWKAGLETEIPEPSTVWEISRGDVSKYVHPTQKPLELINIPITNSSKKGDIVLDFFGGSGSTLMTCEQTERQCRLLELDPYFCDVIKMRYQEATGDVPVLISSL
ncbi:site-specific DNA-methyltransferase [Bacillus siamensis]|uniref:site-specific DNA-methyltransferase n=1 Tax=Bacillus siamensis TaxID=659243 RepID=UPI002E20B06C|nr:site-specific DNA-methyltransferase [Bacillus siamensis]MED0777999.1 site-specific DNA-methyltransferase [Bacillus siamensis]MED0832771.1 site-specific DNA-methyltransferase [Bacillus siamensis]